MKTKQKKMIYILAAVLLAAVIVSAGLSGRVYYLESRLHPVTMPFSEMEKIQICIDRIFPLSDTEKCIGFSDNVFIGTVEEILGTEYEDVSMHSFRLYPELTKTHFRVKALKNIKGELSGELILKTSGGQLPDGRLEEMHPMAENKNTYLFMCIRNEDGLYYFNCIYIGDYDWFSTSENVDKVIEKYEEVYRNEDSSVKKYR